LRNICDMIEAYREGQLSREEELEFEKHLGSCPFCAEELEWLGRLDTLFSRIRPDRPPRGLERQVLCALGFERKPVWSGALGWTTATVVGAWVVFLPILLRITGMRSIGPAARGLADLPSFLISIQKYVRVGVDVLKPLAVAGEALLTAAGHVQVPIAVCTVVLLTIGLVCGFGVWYNLREVSYARSRI
jgi:hypothetical protein